MKDKGVCPEGHWVKKRKISTGDFFGFMAVIFVFSAVVIGPVTLIIESPWWDVDVPFLWILGSLAIASVVISLFILIIEDGTLVHKEVETWERTKGGVVGDASSTSKKVKR